MGTRQRLGWAGGVNLLVDPNAVRDDQLTGAKNTWPTTEGLMTKREAMRAIAPIKHYSEYPFYPLTLFKPDPLTGFDYILNWFSPYINGSEYLSAVTKGMTIQNDANLNITTTSGYETIPGPACMVNYKGRIIAVNGNTDGYFMFYKDPIVGYKWRRNYFQWLPNRPGVTAGQTQTVSVIPRVVCSYKGRLVFGNFGPGFGNTILFADRNPPADWSNVTDAPAWSIIGDDALSSNGFNITFESIAGETILAMAEVSMSTATNPLQTALLVLTDRSAIICTGEPAQTTDTDFDSVKTYLGDFQFAKVNFECGVAGHLAICRGPNGTFWANGEDVYALYDGAPKPIPIGTNIRPALQACPPSYRPFWHMAFSRGAVHLSVLTQATSDFRQQGVQHWRLDLRPTGDSDVVASPGGPNGARWWGPQDYEQAYLLGGSEDGVGVRGALSSAILSDRLDDGKSVLTGAFYGDFNSAADKCLSIVSFNEVSGGRDIPYSETVTGLTWTAATAYAVGDVVMPTPLNRNGRLYVCTVAGTSDVTEPTWPDVNGDSVSDGGITWFEVLDDLSTSIRMPNLYGTTAPRIAMEPDFKEYSFNTPMNDKVVKRGDISAFMGRKGQMWLEVVANSGNNLFYLGPTTIGGANAGKDPAYNSLGNFVLDASSLAEEFESRQLAPSLSVDREKPDSVTPGVIRGRLLQPRLRDGSGFVIDETNDYIVAAMVGNVFTTPVAVVQAQLDHGYYDDVDDVIAEIVDKLNDQTPINWSGWTNGINPWSSNSAYASGWPYFNNLTFAFTARAANQWLLLLVSPDNGDGDYVVSGETYYTSRASNLLAMLGFDTSSAQADASFTGQLTGDTAVTASYVSEIQDPASSLSPIYLNATQVIPYHNSNVVAVSDIEMEVALKKGRPMPTKPRMS